MSWNGFSRNMARKLMNAFTPQHTNNNAQESPSSQNLPKIWIRSPFIGKYGNTPANINKTCRLLKGPCKFILHWRTTQANCFLSSKDKTPNEYQSSVVNQFSCPGCKSSYIGKTDCCLFTRLKEHSTRNSSEINAHINSCKHFQHMKTLMELTPDCSNTIETNLTQLIFDNCKMIDKSYHWSLLLYKESLTMHRRKPELNHSTEASKELIIFQ